MKASKSLRISLALCGGADDLFVLASAVPWLFFLFFLRTMLCQSDFGFASKVFSQRPISSPKALMDVALEIRPLRAGSGASSPRFWVLKRNLAQGPGLEKLTRDSRPAWVFCETEGG